MWVVLGSGVSPRGTESSGLSWLWYRQARLSSACCLMGTLPEHWDSTSLGSGLSFLADVKMGGGRANNMPWTSAYGDWGGSTERPVTRQFFCFLWAVPVPMESAGILEKGWP